MVSGTRIQRDRKRHAPLARVGVFEDDSADVLGHLWKMVHKVVVAQPLQLAVISVEFRVWALGESRHNVGVLRSWR